MPECLNIKLPELHTRSSLVLVSPSLLQRKGWCLSRSPFRGDGVRQQRTWTCASVNACLYYTGLAVTHMVGIRFKSTAPLGCRGQRAVGMQCESWPPLFNTCVTWPTWPCRAQRALHARCSPVPPPSTHGSHDPHGQPIPSWRILVPQVMQLALVLAALILLPARLFSGTITRLHWLLYTVYGLFFCIGSVLRIAKFGKLAKRRSDAQVSSRGRTAALLCFIAAMPTGHWLAAYDYARGGSGAAWLPHSLLGLCLILAALLFHFAAAQVLGKSYDRLTTPNDLVTSGPYAWVQHPIYTSYIALFIGFCLALGSPRAAALLAAACLVYYSQRTGIEYHILLTAFGSRYEEYSNRTARFIPFVW